MVEANEHPHQSAYSIKISAFEGPFDLLLHLLKQNRIDIYDIPIAEITRQYLGYLEIMKELNLEIASEFLVMAATLIYIKSRMLLPPPEEPADGEELEDPRAGLVQRLLEYQAFKEMSGEFRQREDIWSNSFAGPPMADEKGAVEPEPLLFDVNLFDLMGALRKIIDRVPPETLIISRETLTVQDKINLIIDRLEAEQTIRFTDLFAEDRSRLHVIVTFLALLEILRLGLLRAYQEKDFSAIFIMRGDREADMAAGADEQEPAVRD
ncbi:MAG TPA: segregation/condensation protein A [Dissulfurispiraceae bacterium]|nr:segregation/condensation protein A [Dissulfurispiraceae bacterium]